MDITNIENEWKDLKTNNRRHTDMDNFLKDLDNEPNYVSHDNKVKDKVKGLVRSFLGDDSKSEKKSNKNKNSGKMSFKLVKYNIINLKLINFRSYIFF